LVTDITHIRTGEGRLYLAVVLDLFPRQLDFEFDTFAGRTN
jgi:hypothetical protein